MGKIRVKSFGDQEAEEKQTKLAQKRARLRALERSDSGQAEAKAAKKNEGEAKLSNSSPVEAEEQEKTPAKKNTPVATGKGKKHKSTKYQTVSKLVSANKVYSVKEALEILPQVKMTSFDETVELHINTNSTGISGSMTLPHGTGKKTRVAIANEELIAQIEKGQIDFDILISEPQMMAKLARVAKIIGPRGLMPNPKNGTVTPKPDEAAKKYEGGQFNFKTESKFPLLHLRVGKLSFGTDKLQENIKAAIKTVQTKNIKSTTLKSTMSPGLKIDVSSL